MKQMLSRVFGVAVVAIAASSGLFAQSETISAALGDKYVVSAKAGGVNYVEGAVTVTSKDGKTSRLVKGDRVEVGDRVTTGADGRAEILLNPGSYVRLGSNSSFEFITTALDDLRLKFSKGSSVLEVFAANDFTVKVEAGPASYELIQSGVYSIDVTPAGSEIAVWKGRALVNGRADAVLKSGRGAVVKGDQVAIGKFDKDERTALETWSKSRAKELAKMNSSLRPRNLRGTLLNSWGMGGWNMYSSFGLWVWDPYRLAYCFLPFGRGWSSPYGYWFGYDIWSYRLPWHFYYQPYRPSGGGTVTPNPNPNPGPTTRGPIEDRRGSVPPFSRMENPGSGSGIERGGGIERRGGNGPTFDRGGGTIDRTPVIVATPTDSGGSSKKPDQ